MSDHEQVAKDAEREADALQKAGDEVEQHIDDAQAAKEQMYKDPVIAEPLDEGEGEGEGES